MTRGSRLSLGALGCLWEPSANDRPSPPGPPLPGAGEGELIFREKRRGARPSRSHGGAGGSLRCHGGEGGSSRSCGAAARGALFLGRGGEGQAPLGGRLAPATPG